MVQFPEIVPPEPLVDAPPVDGPLGELGRAGGWLAARGAARLSAPRLVVFAADHGIAAGAAAPEDGESTSSAAQFDALSRGGTGTGALAAHEAVPVRAIDAGLDTDDDAPQRIRRGSGSIDREDALTADEVESAIALGRSVADAEVDGGADLLLAAALDTGARVSATAITGALTDTEPVVLVRWGGGVDDASWSRTTAAVRDAMWRARPQVRDSVALLAAIGGADIAALAGFLAQAAVRRTPVLLDDVVVAAAAMVAEDLAFGARTWWLPAHRSPDPAQPVALERLRLRPVLDLGITAGAGVGALTTLGVLRAGAALQG